MSLNMTFNLCISNDFFLPKKKKVFKTLSFHIYFFTFVQNFNPKKEKKKDLSWHGVLECFQ